MKQKISLPQPLIIFTKKVEQKMHRLNFLRRKFGMSCLLINPIQAKNLKKKHVYEAEEALGLVKSLDWEVVSLGRKNKFSKEKYQQSNPNIQTHINHFLQRHRRWQVNWKIDFVDIDKYDFLRIEDNVRLEKAAYENPFGNDVEVLSKSAGSFSFRINLDTSDSDCVVIFIVKLEGERMDWC